MTTAAAKRKSATPPRKGTAPRKAAARRAPAANGSKPNGSAPVSVAPPDASAPGTQNPWAAAPPEEFVPTTKPEPLSVNPPGTPDHPYGDLRVYVFYPTPGGRAGDAPIVFPHITTIRPDYHFMWRLRKLDQIQQSFEWMDMAGVPDTIQERVTLLSDDDQGKFFRDWFTPAVTPAKAEVGLPGE